MNYTDINMEKFCHSYSLVYHKCTPSDTKNDKETTDQDIFSSVNGYFIPIFFFSQLKTTCQNAKILYRAKEFLKVDARLIYIVSS